MKVETGTYIRARKDGAIASEAGECEGEIPGHCR